MASETINENASGIKPETNPRRGYPTKRRPARIRSSFAGEVLSSQSEPASIRISYLFVVYQ